MKYLVWLFTFVICLKGAPSLCQENCKLKKDKDGIKVYTCDNTESKFKSLKAEFLLEEITPDQLKSFLLDGDNYVTWQYDMIESKVLQRINDHEIIVRSVIDAPWPVTNREMIAHLSVNENGVPGELRVDVTSSDYDYPSEEGLVRVPFSEARWEVTTTSENNLSIQYFLRIDPGGSIPTWLVNMAMAEGPYTSFKNLRKQLTEK